MAFDYGTKRIGLAVTDPNKIIATGLDTVNPNSVFEFLKNYMENEKIECFVVGDPKQMNNTPSEIAPQVEGFIKKLIRHYPDIPVKRVDERFTSKIAAQSMLMDGSKKSERRDKSLKDKRSAVIILQTYLEMKNRSEE